MKRMWRFAGLALVIASAVGGGGLPAADTPGPVSAPAAANGRQGIVLFTIDSLRTDHVGCYTPGNAGATPAIDLLAVTGVRFERAYTASVSTTPSAASILTGVLPSTHGLRDDLSGRLRSGIPTVADRLRAAGWSTAAVVGSDRVDSVRGLASGFDLYDDTIKGIRKPIAGLSKERRAAEVADRGLQVFEGLAKEKPFFLWLHFHDPDYDYDPVEPQKSAYPASPYDGEVAATDAAVGSVVRSLRDRLPGARLLFIVAATHGEGLGDRKETGHGFYLNEGTTHVPLIMALGRRGPEA
ncbi:MAG TPA: sulfatase, partial [Dongiaceae bacterium]|nr:sulfatase [Dongiaceae bacterium]